jgi:hypothetical protein
LLFGGLWPLGSPHRYRQRSNLQQQQQQQQSTIKQSSINNNQQQQQQQHQQEGHHHLPVLALETMLRTP